MTQNVFFFYQPAETFRSSKNGSVRALPQKNVYTDLQQVANAQNTAEEKCLHHTENQSDQVRINLCKSVDFCI